MTLSRLSDRARDLWHAEPLALVAIVLTAISVVLVLIGFYGWVFS